MMFARGTVVEHKLMGRGVIINEVQENGETKIEVRMQNGMPQKFYPEELEDAAEIDSRNFQQAQEAMRANKNKWSIG